MYWDLAGRTHEIVKLLMFPISTVNLQCEVTKLGERFEVREMKETILDPFGQTFVSHMSEGSVIPLSACGSSGEFDEVACSSMMILHDYLSEFYFCLCSVVERSEVCFELQTKFFPD